VNLVVDVAAPALTWSAWNVAVAAGAARLPTSWFRTRRAPHATRPLRPRARLGPLGVRRWKRLLPDAGAVIPGVASKRRLGGRDPRSLARYAAEARRSEIVHWLSLTFAACCVAWWPFVVVGPMFLVAVLVNVPCIVALRDNQRRIQRLLARSATPSVMPRG
jgi:glycosyl-4,4'-diaponeurosporenoate acyltransferase